MKTFLQFLDEKEKSVKLYGLGIPQKGFRGLNPSVGPAKPAKPVFNGLNVTQIHPVPRCGKRKIGVMGEM